MTTSPRHPLAGSGTALVTPFTDTGAVDERALRDLVAWQVAEGIHVLVPCGSTGEAATLDADEQERVIAITAEVVDGRIPVVAGVGSNDPRRVIASARAAVRAGATHLLVVSPMYSKPPQRGIVAHFTMIADAVERPVVLYNVPGRTASNMTAATTLALAEHPNIVAMKEASGDVDQMREILRHRPAGFALLSGDDPLTLELMTLGGDGVISVCSNVVPGPVARLCEAMLTGDHAAAAAIDLSLRGWYAAAFLESNPIPVKAALAAMGRIADVLRLPLVPLADEHRPALRAALVACGALTA
ncbi:MAG: 4-hydroxy-tetrahydrodipicolinate synthase [Gemmatimonadaceae bacterium]|nr:4-hydroxy-tetrahydrodipicolinate synthase [Gemmatimonadaceae bacterium]MCU0626342.1 4-hydroxy-tetrahydrodipicolinate synthase [Gemmatimonadaceae bacterium]